MAAVRAGALAALLALAACAEARAGCSSASGHDPARAASAAHLDPLVLGVDDAPAPTPVPNRPCAGLSCSNDPGPSAAPGTPVFRVFEPWACLAEGETRATPTPSGVVAPGPPVLPVHNPTRVFHPPRRPGLRPLD